MAWPMADCKVKPVCNVFACLLSELPPTCPQLDDCLCRCVFECSALCFYVMHVPIPFNSEFDRCSEILFYVSVLCHPHGQCSYTYVYSFLDMLLWALADMLVCGTECYVHHKIYRQGLYSPRDVMVQRRYQFLIF